MRASKSQLITSATRDLYAVVGAATTEIYQQEYKVSIVQY
jgi:hypothetical protein